MERNKNKKPDLILLVTSGLIVLFGIVIFTSVSMAQMAASTEAPETLNLTHLLIRQFVLGLLPGLLVAFLLYRLSIDKIKKISPLLLLFNLVLAALVFVPGLGITIRGATRWISLGGVSFQPSEVLKLTFILYLASWLSSRKDVKRTKRVFSETLIAFVVVCGVISGLILLQPDLSTLIVIVLTGLVMYFSYRTPLKHIAILGVGGLLSFIGFIVLSPYRLERVKDLISSGIKPEGISYQAHQALIAIGSGGLFGLGLGMGRQKYGFLPFAMSDSIFAVYAEEVGFVGSVLLIVLFTVFFWRGIRIAKKSERPFLSLVAVGISFWVFFQAFVHIGSMAGILPITGIPLPFISHGRAHLITELAGVGILLNLSREV